MSNLVRNIISVEGEKDTLAQLSAFLKPSEKDKLFCSLVIPEPEDITTAATPCEDIGVALGEYLVDGTLDYLNHPSVLFGTVRYDMELTVSHTFKSDKELMIAFMDDLREKSYIDFDNYKNQCILWYSNFKKYGYPDQNTWRIGNWGTKWNSNIYPWSRTIPTKNEKTQKYGMKYIVDTERFMPNGTLIALSKLFPDITLTVQYADQNIGYNCGIKIYKNGEVFKQTIYDGKSKQDYEFAIDVWKNDELLHYLKQDKDGNWYMDLESYYFD